MSRKYLFSAVVLCVLVLAVGLGASFQGKALGHSPTLPKPPRTGSSFVPLIPTELRFKAALLAEGLYYPEGIGVTPMGDKVFFAANDYDLYCYKNRAVQYVTDAPYGLHSLRFRGALYGGDNYGNLYKLVNKTTLKPLVEYFENAFIPALDVDKQTGFIYFVAIDNFGYWGAIFKMPPGGGSPIWVADLYDYSWGLAVKGNFLYVSYYYENVIVKLPKFGGPELLVSDQLIGPTDLGFDNEGNIVVAEFWNGAIARIKADSGNVVRIATGLNAPYYLQLDSFGHIYFTDAYAGNLWKLRRY